MSGKLERVKIKPGRYVLAVSGGIDSMVLLDLLSKRSDVEIIVAHFNHGIREDAHKDEELVREASKKLNVAYKVGFGYLDKDSSEAKARTSRYSFLESVMKKSRSRAIITAHHQDDLIETAFINLIRGSGRRGLTSILENKRVVRPLLRINRAQILEYAEINKIKWREDTTNSDTRYLRNYLRLQVLPRLTESQRRNLVKDIDKVAINANELNSLIATLSQHINKNNLISRRQFTLLSPELTGELMTYWLRELGVRDYDRNTIQRLSMGIKTAKPNTELDVDSDLKLIISNREAHFSNR